MGSLCFDDNNNNEKKIKNPQLHGWEMLPHLPYSPYLVPMGIHLFRSLSNVMHGISFNIGAELRAWLDDFLFETR